MHAGGFIQLTQRGEAQKELCWVLFERAESYLCVVATRLCSAGRCDYCKVQSIGDYVKAVFGVGSYCLRRNRPKRFIRGVSLLERQLLYRGIQTSHQWNHSNRKLKCCGTWRRVFGQRFPPFRRIVVLPKRTEPLIPHGIWVPSNGGVRHISDKLSYV